MLTRLRSAPLAQRVVLLLIAATIAIQAGVIANRRIHHVGDFDVSREFGRRLLAGEPLYAGGLHYPYMPAAALYFAPLALLPAWLGFALRYAAAIGCLWLTLRLLHAMRCRRDPALAPQRFALGAITLLLAAHYLVRDLDDGGPHVMLLAMLVAGIRCVDRERLLMGALWLGLAAALKVPNALFIVYFACKRQWRMAAATAAAFVLWALLPLLWMGPGSWWQQQREWFGGAAASAVGASVDGARESEARVQNQALRAVAERYGGRALAGALMAFAVVGVLAWWRTGGESRDWLVDASGVLIVSLLLSPVTWVQHLVLLIPALYVIAAAYLLRQLGAAAMAAMALYALLAVGLNREVLGREVYLNLLAHGLHTVCIVLVLAALLSRPRSAPGAR